jgi:hypothetical protein
MLLLRDHRRAVPRSWGRAPAPDVRRLPDRPRAQPQSLPTPPVRSPRPGRARSCCAPSRPRSTRRRPGPRSSASTAGQTASKLQSCPGWPARSRRGRPRPWPSTPPMAAPTGPPRPSTCWSRRSSGSGTASATSPTTACGCCCTAASGGRLTGPPACEAAAHT